MTNPCTDEELARFEAKLRGGRFTGRYIRDVPNRSDSFPADLNTAEGREQWAELLRMDVGPGEGYDRGSVASINLNHFGYGTTRAEAIINAVHAACRADMEKQDAS